MKRFASLLVLVCGLTLLGADSKPAPAPGRYLLFQGTSNDNPRHAATRFVFKFDTATGKTWVFRSTIYVPDKTGKLVPLEAVAWQTVGDYDTEAEVLRSISTNGVFPDSLSKPPPP